MVANPVKVKDGGPDQRQIRAALARAGWPAPQWLETTWEDPGGGQTRQAVQAGAEVIFACGGDGTVTACASELAGTDVALAVVPAGTGNLLAANLKLPAHPAGAVAAATSRRPPQARRRRGRGPLLHRHGRHGVRRPDAPRHPRDAQGQARLARLRHRRGPPPVRNPYAGQHQPRQCPAVHPTGQVRPGRQRRRAARRPAPAARCPAR